MHNNQQVRGQGPNKDPLHTNQRVTTGGMNHLSMGPAMLNSPMSDTCSPFTAAGGTHRTTVRDAMGRWGKGQEGQGIRKKCTNRNSFRPLSIAKPSTLHREPAALQGPWGGEGLTSFPCNERQHTCQTRHRNCGSSTFLTSHCLNHLDALFRPVLVAVTET